MARPTKPGAATTTPAPPAGYTSAANLPAFKKLTQSRDAMRLLLVLRPSLRGEFRRLSIELDEMIHAVDGFYRLVGDRNWIFHESLRLSELKMAIATDDADAVEAAVMAHYDDPEWMKFAVLRTRRFPSMRPRNTQVQLALNDYREGRYYATTLMLLAVMDGFVNDVELARRGLHARTEDEMVAWNSVVGHHLGLRNAHRTFTKSFNKTSDEPVIELYRNGILHGNLTNFDFKIVAAKAWNRLFSVFDWADSIEAGKKPEDEPLTFRELGRKLQSTAQLKNHIAAWSPRERRTDSDPAALDEPVIRAATALFEAWRTRNYGALSSLTKSFSAGQSRSARAGQARDTFDRYDLTDFRITGMRAEAAAVSHVTAELTINDETFDSDSRWLHETSSGDLRVETQDDGSWRTIHSQPESLAPGVRPRIRDEKN